MFHFATEVSLFKVRSARLSPRNHRRAFQTRDVNKFLVCHNSFISDETLSCESLSNTTDCVELQTVTDPFVFVLGASGLSEKDLVEFVLDSTNPNVRPVKSPSDAVNVTLDITFHGVIDMVSNILFCLGANMIYFLRHCSVYR